MTDARTDLDALGDALQRSAAADLAAGRVVVPRSPRRRRRLAAIAVAVVLVVPAAAVGIARLTVDEGTVAASLPAGTLALMDTEPTCTAVREGVEYLCTLARPPAHEVSDWTGTVEPSVDAAEHVNGGCRSENAEGTTWRCYLGREAVTQGIIGPDFLGERVSGPGVG
ncbi:MAG: hypothetical protein AB7V42_04845 [Thermoleophilia bacterium]